MSIIHQTSQMENIDRLFSPNLLNFEKSRRDIRLSIGNKYKKTKKTRNTVMPFSPWKQQEKNKEQYFMYATVTYIELSIRKREINTENSNVD